MGVYILFFSIHNHSSFYPFVISSHQLHLACLANELWIKWNFHPQQERIKCEVMGVCNFPIRKMPLTHWLSMLLDLASWHFFSPLYLGGQMQAIGEGRNWQQWWSPAFLFQKTGPSLSMKDWIDTQILSSRTRQLLNLVVEMDGYPLPLLRSGCHQRLVLCLSLSCVVEMPYLSLIPFVYFIFISANISQLAMVWCFITYHFISI